MPYLIRLSLADFDSCWICESTPALPNWDGEDLERIRNVLLRLTTLRIENEADADDLVQETLLTMAVKCPERGPEKGLLIWGMGILRRKIGNYYRKTRRHVPLERANADRQLKLIDTPECRFLESEMIDLVGRILRDMPDGQRRAMELCMSGLEACEIAEALRPVRYQNVINRLFRGRRKIAAQLAAHGYAIHARPRQRKREGLTMD